MTILLDVESRSRADLKAIGGRNYWAHPSSEVLCVAWYDVERAEPGTWVPGEPVPEWATDKSQTLVAHNAMGFDRFALQRLGWGVGARLEDSSELARTCGLPGSLDALGTRWLGIPKDAAASRVTKSLSTCRRPKDVSTADWARLPDAKKREIGVQKTITSEVLQRVVDYCVSDVEIMAYAWGRLAPWVGLERAVTEAERSVNDRGVYFDVELAEAMLVADAENSDKVVRRVARQLGCSPAECRANAKSQQKFCAITGAPNAQKGTVALIDHPLAEVRQALATIAKGKLTAGLSRVSPDGRIRDAHRYYGAHTGRWSQRGMQLHNLPRPAKRFADWKTGEIESLVGAFKRTCTGSPDEIAMLLRGTIAAPAGKALVVSDFAGIEARALAWCSRDYDALSVFASGRDPYKVMASTIFGVRYDAVIKDQRGVGKAAVLGCGYGMGHIKFDQTCAAAGMDLEAIGVDAKRVVQAWRKIHSASVRFWYELEGAFASAVAGRSTRVGVFSVEPSDDGRDVLVFLPSGRPVVYPEARRSGRELAFLGTKSTEHTYGGKLTENIIQAMCRDLLAHALVEAERVGLCPVLHVHDEIVCEVDVTTLRDAEEALHEIMTTPPEWAEGFPLGAQTFSAPRYRK